MRTFLLRLTDDEHAERKRLAAASGVSLQQFFKRATLKPLPKGLRDRKPTTPARPHHDQESTQGA